METVDRYSPSASMLSRSITSKFAAVAILLCAVLWPCRSFADQQVRADFDGDGQLDAARVQPRGVVVWLSRTRAFSALRGSGHPLRLAAVDLDRDGRPELVALDAARGLRVWKTHKSGKLHPYRPRAPTRGPSVHGSTTLDDDPIGIEEREPTYPRDAFKPVLSARHPVDTSTTRLLVAPPDRDPRTCCSCFTPPRAPPAPSLTI
jgi:VCBS repeat protein